MPKQLRYLLMGLACAVHTPAIAAPPISVSRAQSLLPEVAKIQLQRDSTTGLLGYCASHFAPLKPKCEQARSLWLQHNKAILVKTQNLRERLWQSLKQQLSGLKAETTILNYDQLVQQNVRKKIEALAAYNPVQQRLICQQLIGAVRVGDWDVSRQETQAYAILKKFH